ncbi:MAG TPA: DUF2723 domain-containing protein [Patescibacteria group bacterium]|nr:DUF2723 domain-containing protein [Patescibacteria group bacterium]
MTQRNFFLLSVSVLFLSFLLYVHNLSRGVYGGDVGDLVTAAYVGGLPHAPGYPLFTFLGFLLTRFPFFPSPAFTVGLISAASGALSVLFFFLTIRKLTKNILVSLITGSILSFSFLFWFYNEIAEVFALNSFFAIFLLYLAISFYQKSKTYLLFFFTFILGLAASHHQTIVFIFPSLFLIILAGYWEKKKTLFRLLPFLGFTFICGFLPYAYALAVSRHNPPILWDKVTDWQSFLYIILRKDYGTFSGGFFAPPTVLQRFVIMQTYLFTLLVQLTIPVIVISAIGVISLFRKQKILCIAILLAFFLSGPVFISYAGFPLYGAFYIGTYERFFVLSSIMLLYFFPFGLITVINAFAIFLHRNVWRIVIPSVFFIIPVALLFYNFPKTDLSHIMTGDYLGEDFIQSLPKNSVFFVGGDTTLFNTQYVHFALRIRPDVQIVNLDSLGRDAFFLSEEQQYKKTHPFSPSILNEEVIIREIQKTHPVFAISGVQPEKKKDLQWIPFGLTFRLLLPHELPPDELAFTDKENWVWQSLHIPSFAQQQTVKSLQSLSIADIPNTYVLGMLVAGNYYLTQYKDIGKAKQWYEKALVINPDFPQTHQMLAIYYLTGEKNCKAADIEFQTTLALDPLDRLSYFLLHKVYADCEHNKSKVLLLEQQFQQIFHESYQKAFSATMKAA